MTEEWRAVIGFEGAYEVSNLGRVRSLDREIPYNHFDHYSGRTVVTVKKVRGKILRPGTVKSGHQFVVLGRGNGVYVHTLVLNAFVGACPAGQEGCHGDGNPANNVLGNLRWDTRLANVHDMLMHGTHRWQKEAHA